MDQLSPSTLPPPVTNIQNTTGDITKEVWASNQPLPALPPLLSENKENFHSNTIGVAMDNDGNPSNPASSSEIIAPSTPQKSVLPGVDQGCVPKDVIKGMMDDLHQNFLQNNQA